MNLSAVSRARVPRVRLLNLGLSAGGVTLLVEPSGVPLDHTDFRQCSSQLGRSMHPDPAGLNAVDPSNPQSWNRYSYVFNNLRQWQFATPLS